MEDLPIQGATVTLYYGDGVTAVPGAVMSSNGGVGGTTGADGFYQFQQLPLGKYVVKISALSGYTIQTGSIDVLVNTTEGNTFTGKNLSYSANTSGGAAKGRITGYVFFDADSTLPQGNNSPNTADVMLGGVQMTLYKDGVVFLKQKTGANRATSTSAYREGMYEFTGLEPGDYTVKMEPADVPSTYVFQDDTDSKFPLLTPPGGTTKAPYEISDLNISAGTSHINQNFWYVRAGATTSSSALISSYSQHYPGNDGGSDGNVIPSGTKVPIIGVTIPVTYEITELDGTVVYTFVTDHHGAANTYTWLPDNALPVGRYLAKPKIIHPGYQLSQAPDPLVRVNDYIRVTDRSGTAAYGLGQFAYVGDTETDWNPENSGFKGKLFFDSNGNGAWDSGEALIANARLVLSDDTGKRLAVSSTKSDGTYHFQRLPKGNYRVQVTFEYVDGGRIDTNGDGIADTDMLVWAGDSDGVHTDKILNVSLTSSGAKTDQDIWFSSSEIEPFYVYGTAYIDSDGDGAISPMGASNRLTDMRLRGALVELLDSSGNPVLDGSSVPITSITNNNGEYRINGLQAGTTYQIRISKAGYTALLTGDVQTVTMPTVQGYYLPNDFLLAGKSGISGLAYLDMNGDGIYSTTAPSDSTATVQHFEIIDADTGISYGSRFFVSGFNFQNLGPGKYKIKVTPAGAAGVCFADTDPASPVGEIIVQITEADTTPYENNHFALSYSRTSSVSVIQGKIRLDTNANGQLDNSGGTEDDFVLIGSGVAGISVEVYRTSLLRDAGGIMTPMYTVAVNSDGTFDIPRDYERGNGNFILKFKGIPAGYTVVNDQDGTSSPSEAILGDPLGTIQLSAATGGNYLNMDLLLKADQNSVISGAVFIDGHFDDTFNLGIDPGMVNTTISLKDSGGTVISTQKVRADGTYSFEGLSNGTYTVWYDNDQVPTSYFEAAASISAASQRTVTISNMGDQITDRNFWFQPKGLVGIAGRVGVDLNDNGTLEASGDFFLEGVTVTLTSPGGAILDTATTNAGGNFLFIGLTEVGNYKVTITLPAHYAAYTGTTDLVVNVPKDTMVTNQNFLLVGDSNASPGSPGVNSGVAGYLYVGSNATPTGVALVGNPVQLTLYDILGNKLGTTTTDSIGKYQFYNLAEGKYTVKINSATIPGGYGLDGDVDGAPIGEIIVDVDANQTAASTALKKHMWFIVVSEKGISGKVTYSPTQSTTASAGDALIGGITVELYDPANLTGTPLYTTTTKADGTYSFTNIPTTNYVVKVKDQEKIDGGYIDLTPTDGKIPVILPGAGVENQNFILGGTRSLSGKVGVDSDGDDAIDIDLANVHTKVTWYGSDGVLGTADDVILSSDSTVSGAAIRATGETNVTGDYSYATLPNGNYKIEVLDSTLTSNGMGLITTITGNTNPQDKTNVTANQTGINFTYGYVGVISGKVTIDVDRSASSTEADQTMSGPTLTIRLEDSSNAANFKTLTTTDGTFSFTGIDPTKTWKVSVSSGVATGYNFSFGLGDSNNTTVGNEYATVALTGATPSKTDVVLGYKGSGKISGKVVMDNVLTDGRVATSADTSLGANIKVTVSSSATGFTSWTVQTNAAGEYEITELAPYTYTISIDRTQSGFPTGLVESFDPASTETAPTPPSGTGSAAITLSTQTETLTNKDFGYRGRGSISGKILIDVENGGTYTAADTAFGSVLTVTATNGTITRTTTTNAATGEYSFGTVPTGIWEIYVASPPTDYSNLSYGVGSPGSSVEVSGNRVKVDIDSAIGTRATTPTLNAVEVNIGYRGSAAISGRLIYDNEDTDGNAYNSSVDTFFAAGHIVTLSGGSGFTARTTTTNASGEYAFTGLTTYADYKVTVTSPTGYMVSFDPDSAVVTPPAIPVGDGEAIIPIASSNEVKALQDFAFKGAGKIAGKIYIDLNDNGTFESAVDQPKSGIVVTLTHPTLPSRTATTDINGDYESTGIAVGEWTATITGGTSGLRSPSFDFDDPFASSGSPATPLSAVVQVTTSSLVADHVDFGFINRGKLEGAIKEDTYASGIYDASAPGIAGVTVYLVENDGVTPKTYADGTPIVLTTDESGLFTARNLDCPTSGSTYSVRVEFGPNTTGPLSMMEPSYDSDVSGAGYGSGVNLAAGTHVVNADLADPLAMRAPLDLHLGYRTSTGDIVIHKVAGKSTAKIGDIVPYTITIENISDAPALNVTIEDLIPAGFKYVDGSSRLDGEKIEDPTGNRPLRFEKMDLGGASGAGTENAKCKLSYFLVVGSGVTQGEYTNSAIAKDQFNRNSSNVSQATVEITSDPLFDDSLIFGKVYIDANGNGEQDAEEEGLGGIKLATGRGEIITTDEHGRYHIPAVDGGRWERGRNFILKLDVRSLPAGYKVISDNPIVVRTSPGLPSKINFRVIEEKTQETAKE